MIRGKYTKRRNSGFNWQFKSPFFLYFLATKSGKITAAEGVGDRFLEKKMATLQQLVNGTWDPWKRLLGILNQVQVVHFKLKEIWLKCFKTNRTTTTTLLRRRWNYWNSDRSYPFLKGKQSNNYYTTSKAAKLPKFGLTTPIFKAKQNNY